MAAFIVSQGVVINMRGRVRLSELITSVVFFTGVRHSTNERERHWVKSAQAFAISHNAVHTIIIARKTPVLQRAVLQHTLDKTG